MQLFQPRDQTRLLSVTWLPTVKIFCEGDNSPFPLNGLIERTFSHIGHSPETNFTQLVDLVKRRRTCFCRYCTPLTKRYTVLQLSPNGPSASRFTNLVMRLLDQVSFLSFAIMLSLSISQPVLARKREAVLFLFTLSTFNPRQHSSIQIPAIAYPKHPAINAVPTNASTRKEKGRSNADLLKDFRATKGIEKRCLLHY